MENTIRFSRLFWSYLCCFHGDDAAIGLALRSNDVTDPYGVLTSDFLGSSTSSSRLLPQLGQVNTSLTESKSEAEGDEEIKMLQN